MYYLLTKGIVTGFILSIMIGPVFFMLLELSIRKGARAAMSFDLGVLLSDVLYIAIAFFFFSEIKELTTDGNNEHWMKIGGGIIFIGFGLVFLLKKNSKKDEEFREVTNTNKKEYFLLGLKGFFLNFTNPMVIFYWLSVLTLGASDAGKSDLNESVLIYVIVILITFFSIDLLKIFGAKKLRPFITDKVLLAMNRLTGIVIMLTGVILLFQGIQKL